jgi:hypothetical protein
MPEFETVKVLADIIAHEMDIPAEQMALYDQSIPAPGQLTGIYIAIDIIGKEVVSNNIRHESRKDDDDLWQLQTMQVKEQICINVASPGAEADGRNHEIVFALGSTYAQQMQEKYGLHIGRIPSAFTKTPATVTAGANAGVATSASHYTITVIAQRAHYKESVVDSFNQFQPVSIITNPSNHNSTP